MRRPGVTPGGGVPPPARFGWWAVPLRLATVSSASPTSGLPACFPLATRRDEGRAPGEHRSCLASTRVTCWFSTPKRWRERPGRMVEVDRTVRAPPGLGTDVVSVPEGASIELQLRLESVIEGVLVSGTCRDAGKLVSACDVWIRWFSISTSTCRSSSPTPTPLLRMRRRSRRWRTSSSTSGQFCGTPWCSPFPCNRCARTTVSASAPSAAPGSTTTGAPPRPGRPAMGRPGGPAPAGLERTGRAPARPERLEGHRCGRPEAEDVALQHPFASGELEGQSSHDRHLRPLP